jgi:hypothetical protein
MRRLARQLLARVAPNGTGCANTGDFGIRSPSVRIGKTLDACATRDCTTQARSDPGAESRAGYLAPREALVDAFRITDQLTCGVTYSTADRSGANADASTDSGSTGSYQPTSGEGR